MKYSLQGNYACADSPHREAALALMGTDQRGPRLPAPAPHVVFAPLLIQEAHLLETRAHHKVQDLLLLLLLPHGADICLGQPVPTSTRQTEVA